MMRRVPLVIVLLTAVCAATPAAQAAKKHFLWAIRHPGAPVTYVMGSLHVLTPQYYPLSPTIDQAFAQSKVLIEEADLEELENPATMLSLVGKALLTDGRTLDTLIAPNLYKQVVVRAEAAGMPELAVQRMKPWMAALALIGPALKQRGFSTDLSVDKHFFDRAKKVNMERRALETVAYQFDRLDQLPMPIQESMLKATLSDLDTQLSNVNTIADAWAAGDTRTVERLMHEAYLESPETYDRLLIDRNRNWVAPVERCLQEKTACFVVVGAAHLVGPHSLIALLQKKGYRVEQVEQK